MGKGRSKKAASARKNGRKGGKKPAVGLREQDAAGSDPEEHVPAEESTPKRKRQRISSGEETVRGQFNIEKLNSRIIVTRKDA